MKKLLLSMTTCRCAKLRENLCQLAHLAGQEYEIHAHQTEMNDLRLLTQSLAPCPGAGSRRRVNNLRTFSTSVPPQLPSGHVLVMETKFVRFPEKVHLPLPGLLGWDRERASFLREWDCPRSIRGNLRRTHRM